MVRVLALIKDGERLVGLRLFDEKSTSIGDFSIVDAMKFMGTYGCSNATIGLDNTLQCTECSIDRLPVLSTDLKVSSEGGVFILAYGKYDNTTYYDIVNVSGKVKRCREDVLLKFLNAETLYYKKKGIGSPVLINAKVVTKDGKTFISAIRGTFKEIPVDELKGQYNRDLARTDCDGVPMSSFRNRQIQKRDWHCRHDETIKAYMEDANLDFLGLLGCNTWAEANTLPSKQWQQAIRKAIDIYKLGAWTSFMKKNICVRYGCAYDNFTYKDRKYVVVTDSPMGEGYFGICDFNTGKIILPCWFGSHNSMWYHEINVYGGRYVEITTGYTKNGVTYELAGFVDMETHKVTKFAYDSEIFYATKSNVNGSTGQQRHNLPEHLTEYMRKNLFTGKVVDIRDEFEKSTETLEDLVKFVPDLWTKDLRVTAESRRDTHA